MYLERDGVRLFYDVQGEGEPTILLVHGWGFSHEIWREQVEEFSKDHRVVTPDLRGYGRSDKPETEYTFELFADDLDYLIRSLDLEKPILVGWSMGASIALEYAATHPEQVSKLVLVDGTPVLVASEDFPYAGPPEALVGLSTAMEQDYSAGMRAFAELIFPEPGTDQLKEWAYGLTQQTTPSIALNTIANSAAADLRPLLDRIKAPTLILHGELDQACTPAANQYMHSQIPDSRIHEFAGKGHAPFLTDTEAFNKQLRGFVS